MEGTQSYTPPELTTLRDVMHDTSSPAIIDVNPYDDPTSITTTTLSHLALKGAVASYADTLCMSVSPRSVVAIVMPNCTQCIVSFLAVTSAAHIAAPLNPAYTTEEFTFYLEDSSASAVILLAEVEKDAPIRKAAEIRSISIIEFPSDLLSKEDISNNNNNNVNITFPSLSLTIPKPNDIALFLHTSGTTSRPKGVPLSHKNLVTSVRNIATTYELIDTDRTLLVMPLFHVHGLMAATLATLASQGTIIIPPGGKFSASKFWPSAQCATATWYTAVPTMHQILLARAKDDYNSTTAPTLRFIRSCSASLAPVVLRRLEETFGAPVLEAYAMTEASHQMTSNPLPKYGPRKAGSVGKAQNVNVVILNDNNDILNVGEVGEVCIRGENVTKGYNNNEKANESAFAGGWFHTGDQGWLDENGYLTLTGRIKELVNRGGEKISPLEIDAALLAHNDVKEAVSFAVPDEKYGEEVNAAVILKDKHSGVGVEELKEFALSKLAAFKIPKRFFICDDLPRTATGKIQRRIVAKHFLDQLD